ncbi:MAG: sigma-70 family RNA polymerase sigma factor [Chloroflexi bacterium]|nr:MAG: sigma-70 family RNA polymerase sigma factor [Chloroflexota bacterium]
MPASDEAQLVARAKEGDIEAFEALYEQYKGSVYRTVLAITHDRGAAEEILQESFLRAFQHIDSVREGAPISPWIHRIAINLSYTWVARRSRLLTSLEQVVDRLTASPGSSPERAVEQDELQQVVREAIDQLEFRQRATIVLFYLEGFSLAEIAEIMDCPVGTVKSRLHYAREKLREALLADQRLPRAVAYEFT